MPEHSVSDELAPTGVGPIGAPDAETWPKMTGAPWAPLPSRPMRPAENVASETLPSGKNVFPPSSDISTATIADSSTIFM